MQGYADLCVGFREVEKFNLEWPESPFWNSVCGKWTGLRP